MWNGVLMFYIAYVHRDKICHSKVILAFKSLS